MNIEKNRKEYYSYVGIYTFIFAAIGILYPLIGQYLAEIGFTGVQIGIITASATAVGIGASPFWGCQYHNRNNSIGVILFLCGTVTFLVLAFIFIKHFLVFLLLYAVFAFFQIPIIPLSDAMTLEARAPYGAVRKWGAIGFAAGVFFAGQIAEATNLVVIFPLCAASFFMAGLIFFWKRRKKGRIGVGNNAELKKSGINNNEESETSGDSDASAKNESYGYAAESYCSCEKTPEKKRTGYAVLFQNKKLMALMLSAFFICGTNVAHNTYFGFLYKEVGGSIAGIGIALLLMCLSEAPFMAWVDRLSKKFTLERLILITMIMSAMRFFWFSTGPSPELLIGTFFLQGIINGIVIVDLIQYVAKLVDPIMIGMAMTLYQSLSANCSTILCQLIGGSILDHFGGAKVYLFFGIYNTIGVILYVAFGLYKSGEKKYKKEVDRLD